MAYAVFIGAVGALLLGTGLGAVTSRNLVHSVFWLAAMLLATSVLYIGLDAPFLAAIQVLLYTGGVITMMLFGVMLTQRDPDTAIPSPALQRPRAAVVAGLFAVTVLLAIWTTPELASRTVVPGGAADEVGRLFLNRYLVAFEVLSVLLLGGMIGAIVLARRGEA